MGDGLILKHKWKFYNFFKTIYIVKPYYDQVQNLVIDQGKTSDWYYIIFVEKIFDVQGNRNYTEVGTLVLFVLRWIAILCRINILELQYDFSNLIILASLDLQCYYILICYYYYSLKIKKMIGRESTL